jgi:hypothetical protein
MGMTMLAQANPVHLWVGPRVAVLCAGPDAEEDGLAQALSQLACHKDLGALVLDGVASAACIFDGALERLAPLLRSLALPIVATARGVNAAALLSCDEVDVVVAARTASFLGPFDANIQSQAKALGMHRPGATLGAAEAARWGLVWRCVPDDELANSARSVAEGLAGNPQQTNSTRRS